MRNNIILIGYMGCGKSTIGKYLAEQKEYTFVDTDQLIEEEQGCSISEIFATQGEKAFRDMETALLEKLVEEADQQIIATGGGLPLREYNGILLKQLGLVVYLKARKDTVITRLAGDTTRPLLQVDDLEEKVEQMLTFRDPIYEYTAHFVMETDNKSVEEIAEDVIRNHSYYF